MRVRLNWKSALSIALLLLFAWTSLLLLYLFYPQLIYELDSVSNLDSQYSVRTYRSSEGGTGYCEVLYGRRRIFSCSGRQAFFVELLGTDVTGNAQPNLVLRQWLGSAHGDSRYRVLELDGPTVREIGVIEGLLDVKWQDVDGDGIVEVTGRDRAHGNFMGGDFAGSPRPMVVLTYNSAAAGFRPDKQAMSRPPLSESQFDRLSVKYKEAISGRKGSRLPTEFADTLFALIYSGNTEQAWQLLDASWPDDAAEDKTKFRESIKNSLARSPFYPTMADWI